MGVAKGSKANLGQHLSSIENFFLGGGRGGDYDYFVLVILKIPKPDEVIQKVTSGENRDSSKLREAGIRVTARLVLQRLLMNL